MAGAGDLPTVTIASPQLQATFVPGAGMVCSSLRHDGAQLLAQRNGVRAYAERGSTMGIPLLYPWANRLAGLRYPGAHAPVDLACEDSLLKLDANGLPIHGALAGMLPWELLDDDDDATGDRLHARLRWQRADLLAIFPFAHVLELRARVDGATLTIETSVRAPAGAPARVPVSFGYHPYLTLAGLDRAAWRVKLPVSRRLLLDERMIPTGASVPFEDRRVQLAQTGWDDAFAVAAPPAVFAVSGGGRQIELELREGYPYAQVYAPAGEQFVCFEPMAAPTNALISREDLPMVPAGGMFRAAFAISARRGISDA
jgi:galactose mutarotase-like enzyme